MFSGIGGFEKGIEDAEKETSTQVEPSNHWNSEEFQCSIGRNTCIGYSEIDRYPTAIYRYHYSGHRNFGDARQIVPDELPSLDLICAGFPCQSFSIAGKRGGFEDTRGTLFFEIARIARVKRPHYLLLENVKGLLSHDKGNTFATIVSTLDELGYDCEWCVLNSKNYGVPQNRERVFIIGYIREQPRLQVFPLGETGNSYSGVNREVANCLDANYGKGWLDHGQRTMVMTRTRSNQDYKHAEAEPPLRQSDKAEVRILHNAYPDGIREYKDMSPAISTPDGGGHLPYVAQALQTDGYLRNGTSFNTDKPQSARNIRRLTPTECERLQGFPDNWTKYGLFEDGKVREISDTQRYKCLGNAVTTNVIKAIMGKFMMEAVLKARSHEA